MSRTMSRRAFLQGAVSLGGLTALTGCNMMPQSRFWGLWTQAEGTWAGLLQAGPLKHALAKTYPESAISKMFPVRSLTLPETYAPELDKWRLVVDGLVAEKRSFSLPELQAAFPRVAEVTRHDCVEGWSAIAGWAGVRLADFMTALKPSPEARFVVFHSADADDGGAPYYGSLTIEQARHPQTLLAYEMNGQPLPLDHGAPLRLKVPTQLGYKSTKFIRRIEFVADLGGLGGGKGGYWEDAGYEHYAGI